MSATFTALLCAYLVAHVRVCEQADVRLSSVHAISGLEGIEARSVQDDIVALLVSISEDVGAIGAGGTSGRVGDEETKATPKLEVYHRSKRGIANELLSNGPLLVTVIDVGGKAGGRGMLESGQRWIADKTWVAHSETGGHHKSCFIASKMGSLENGATGITVFIDSDPTIIGLERVTNEEHAYEIFDHPP